MFLISNKLDLNQETRFTIIKIDVICTNGKGRVVRRDSYFYMKIICL